MIAVATVNQMRKSFAHVFQNINLFIDFIEMLAGNGLYLCTGAIGIGIQAQQGSAFLN